MNHYEKSINSFLSSVGSGMAAVYLPAYFVSLIELLEDYYKFDVLIDNDYIQLEKNTFKISYELICSYFLSNLLRIRKQIPDIKVTSRGKSHEERFVSGEEINSELLEPTSLINSDIFEARGKKIIQDMRKQQNVIKVFEKRCPILECKKDHIKMDIVAADSLIRNSIIYTNMAELICFQYLSTLSVNLELKAHIENYFIRGEGRQNFSQVAQNYVIEYQEYTCFYCKKKLEESYNRAKPSADHFIPWIFLKTSLVENLVFACSDCNRSKSDRLASFNYFNKLLRRNVPESEFWNDCPVEIDDIESRVERWTRNYHQATEQLSVGWRPEEIYA